MKFKLAPVIAGQKFIVTPFTEGKAGDAIAKIDNYTIIIKDKVVLGKKVKIIIEEVFETYAYAKKV